MRLLLILTFCAGFTIVAAADYLPLSTMPEDSVNATLSAYTDSLTALVTAQKSKARQTKPSPYLFRIFAPGTVYSTALAQDMSFKISKMEDQEERVRKKPLALGTVTDYQLQLHEAMNRQLNIAYIQKPQLFSITQDELMNTSKLRSDLAKPVEEETKIAEDIKPLEMPDVEASAVIPEIKRPNFWTFKGNGSLQFTQTYFSDNWYQGGEKNYTMLSQLTGEMNYDNKRKIQWNNKLEAQLGFQTSESTEPKFRATSNLLRFTSNLGIKAIGNWNYAAQLQLETQPYMNYDKKGENVTADFLSPLYIRSSIGMDFVLKKKKIEGKLHLAPLSYVITYVDREALISRHGIREGHNTKHEWGPNIDVNFTYKIWTNISWTGRIYWFSNLELTRIECENTFNFTINKYLSSKLYLYPRYDDSSTKYKAGEEHDGDYWMFKEWLSLGFNYNF